MQRDHVRGGILSLLGGSINIYIFIQIGPSDCVDMYIYLCIVGPLEWGC